MGRIASHASHLRMTELDTVCLYDVCSRLLAAVISAVSERSAKPSSAD